MTSITLPLSSSIGIATAWEGCAVDANPAKIPTVLMVHGVGLQSAAWKPQVEFLKQTHRVVAVDMPGHGGSAALPANSSLEDFVRWLSEVVSALQVSSVNVVGHSMGALIAMGFAVEYPALTQRVAVLNGVYRRDPKASAAVILRAADIKNGPVDFQTPLARWFGDSPTENATRRDVGQWLNAVDLQGYATAYQAFARGDTTYADRLHSVKCPLLALTGEKDPNSTPAMSDAIAAQVSNGVSVIVEGQRHMVNLTAADTVNSHLAQWLSQPVPNTESIS